MPHLYGISYFEMLSVITQIPTYGHPSVGIPTIGTLVPSCSFSSTHGFNVGSEFLPTYGTLIGGSIVPKLGFPYSWSVSLNCTPPLNNGNVSKDSNIIGNNNTHGGNKILGNWSIPRGNHFRGGGLLLGESYIQGTVTTQGWK